MVLGRRQHDCARRGDGKGADHVDEGDVELEVARADAAQERGREAPHALLLAEAVDQRRRDARREPAPADAVGVADGGGSVLVKVDDRQIEKPACPLSS